jgi:GT2 family glycosyltransferase
MSDCSVVIVNYNTGKMLSEVTDTVVKSKQKVSIIIVDNNSIDNSMELIEDDPNIRKLFREKNYGFADSCNYGASFVKTPFVLFLNPDCYIQPETIQLLVYELEQNKKAAIIGCLVCNPDKSEQRASRRRLPTFWRAFKTKLKIEKLAKFSNLFAGINLNHQSMPKSTVFVEAVSGAFILMKTEVFKQIGGFDNKFPLHFEDLDLFKRTRDQGYQILFNPNVKVIHYQGTSSKMNPKVVEFKKVGLKRYFKKHGSIFSQIIINFFIK